MAKSKMTSLPNHWPVTKAFSLLVIAISLAGCGGAKNRVAVYPVTGSVRHAGVPATGAKVVFYAMDRPNPKIPFPTGVVQEDGSFRLTSYKENDGAPVGAYKVSIVWMEPVPPERE